MSSSPSRDGNESSRGLSIKPVSLSLGSTSTKKTGFNLQNASRPTDSPKPQTLACRPYHLHHEDDESDDGGEPVFESVTGFDTLTGTTISADAEPERKPLTIPVASGNNWRDRPGVIRRPTGKNLLPKEVQALQEARRKGKVPGNEVETAGPSMSYGLSFAQGTSTATEGGGRADDGDQSMDDVALPVEERKPLTEDEIALRALVRESKGEVEGRSDLVIESRQTVEADGDHFYDGHDNETKSFRADVASRPESASLDQYNAIPVEEFGAALLRGMGWTEGQAVGKGKYGSSDPNRASTPHVPARRPGFLGIGAKDVSGGKGAEVELGAWGKAAMRKGSRKAGEGKKGEQNTDGVYMPVLMRNKKTGETITADELAALQKEARARDDSDDWRERRDRNLQRSGRDRDRGNRRLEYEKDGDSDRYESRRNGSSRRDRSQSASDRRSRRRRYDENSDGRDDRYYRDRDREHRSDRERDRERERDQDRKSSRYYDDRYSSRHSSSNASSRHRERDRASDRESHRRRKYDD